MKTLLNGIETARKSLESKSHKNIDSNIGYCLKADAKFYAIDVSLFKKELRVMWDTE